MNQYVSHTNHRAKILIVDDEPFNIDYLEQELEEFNYETFCAGSGREALSQVSAVPPDLILLDIMMPGMDGFAVLERLKADTLTRHIPVIVVSAMDDMRNIVQGIKLGAEDYLAKPFDPVLLQARISSSLERKWLRDQEQLYLQGMEKELEIGQRIQAGFLPEELPQLAGWDVAAHFQAAREVAGDFYDAFVLPREGCLALVLGDVADKGVGAALFMTLFHSLIRALANWDIYSGRSPSGEPPGPAATLRETVGHINNYIEHVHGSSGIFATIFFGLLNPATGALKYVNAGHESPFILNDGSVREELPPTGPAVGVIRDADFHVDETHLHPGDTLLVLTDGVTDALDTTDQMYGKARLLGLLKQPHDTAAGLLAGIVADSKAFMGDAGQFDDITMMAVRRT